MKKLIYLTFLAIGMTGCSVESMDSDELVTADAKFKAQDVEKSMHLQETEICFGEAPTFVFNFPQDSKGNGDPKETDIQIQQFNPDLNEWEQIEKLSYSGSGPEEYTYEDEVFAIGTYDFRVSIGSGGFDYTTTLDVVECSDCQESFSYEPNEDGSYTFTYIPEEDMDGAEVVFTFAQGTVVSGYEWANWNGSSSTRTEIMNLEACETYTWTVSLVPDCSGQGNSKGNVWTDFKINDVSKKGDLGNIEITCN